MTAWTTATPQSDQPLNNAPLLRSPTKPNTDERLKVATNDLFELLERVQCSRLDDQRCVLPAYFLQVCALPVFSICSDKNAEQVLSPIFCAVAARPNKMQLILFL